MIVIEFNNEITISKYYNWLLINNYLDSNKGNSWFII